MEQASSFNYTKEEKNPDSDEQLGHSSTDAPETPRLHDEVNADKSDVSPFVNSIDGVEANYGVLTGANVGVDEIVSEERENSSTKVDDAESVVLDNPQPNYELNSPYMRIHVNLEEKKTHFEDILGDVHYSDRGTYIDNVDQHRRVHPMYLRSSSLIIYDREKYRSLSPGYSSSDDNGNSSLDGKQNIWDINSDSPDTFLYKRLQSFDRKGAEQNEKWRDIINKVEHYLDVHSLLMIRQTCVALYSHKYTLNPNNELCFRGFVGYDSNVVVNCVLPLLIRVLRITDKVNLALHFSQCYNFKNVSVVHMLTRQSRLQSRSDIQAYCRNMRELTLDYCHHLNDKALEVMLTTKLPNLEMLSLVGCRNENMVGTPFIHLLTAERWPKFTKFNCSFSNISIDPIQAIADVIIKSGTALIQDEDDINERTSTTEEDSWITGTLPSCCSRSDVFSPPLLPLDLTASPMKDPMKHAETKSNIKLEICGSWGSRMFLDRYGFGADLFAFGASLKMKNKKLCSRLTKRVQRTLEELSLKEDMKADRCLQLLKQRGSEFLVNCPIIEQTNASAMDMWTLPVSIAIMNDDMEMFDLLIRRGARVNIWDHCGKSPLYTACEVNADRFVKKLLKSGQAPEPVDIRGFSPLSLSIERDNAAYLEQFLNAGFLVNKWCPHLRNYMSPLYLACKSKSNECIKLLLERGANTNWLYHGRITPTLVAYQNDKRWLPVFIKYGAGRDKSKRYLLSDVMSCAISNNDVESVAVLFEAYPDLMDREHKIWSKPIIQAAQLGKYDVLKMMLDKGVNAGQEDKSMKTALHVAVEDNRIDCVKLLIEHKADLDRQDVLGRTPLYIAVIENRVEAIEILLEHGCDVNIADFSAGETPLMAALRTRNWVVGNLILSSAEDIKCNQLDKLGRSACVYCLYFENYELGQVILGKYIDMNLEGAVTDVRWFHAISRERINCKTETLRALKKYVKMFNRVHSLLIKQNSEALSQCSKRSLMQSLREKLMRPISNIANK
ncbi:ankyrin repeat and protein kinase domain-containing protein [Babesia gibsoni]|uniref:Ankyrin repeat and protein kinase domain-containing protein n=1 Tax=Babesia gibsoni TaxID=33632 RepID=A0AAD8PFY4_BABGI|nr:ankyrin repeat and protein kinase domain-containing protein [Babesia gibsoni]